MTLEWDQECDAFFVMPAVFEYWILLSHWSGHTSRQKSLGGAWSVPISLSLDFFPFKKEIIVHRKLSHCSLIEGSYLLWNLASVVLREAVFFRFLFLARAYPSLYLRSLISERCNKNFVNSGTSETMLSSSTSLMINEKNISFRRLFMWNFKFYSKCICTLIQAKTQLIL